MRIVVRSVATVAAHRGGILRMFGISIKFVGRRLRVRGSGKVKEERKRRE